MSVKELLKQCMPGRRMQFASVVDDDDELSRLIKNDPQAQDDKWDLDDSVDAGELAAFWQSAVDELEPADRNLIED